MLQKAIVLLGGMGAFLAAGAVQAAEPPVEVAAAAETVYVTNKGDTLFHLREGDSGRPVQKVEEVKTPSLLVQSGQDTIIILKRSSVDLLVNNVSQKVQRSRELGYGGAGGPTPGFLMVDIKPVRDLVNREAGLNAADFGLDSRYASFLMMGGMGYGGVGHGIRIGGMGWAGSRAFTSLPAGNLVTELNVQVGYGGFLVEKALVRKNWNLVVGGTMGGGSITVEKTVYRSDETSAFHPLTAVDTLQETASTEIYSLEVHGAFTYTLLPWFHLGVDASTAGFFSPGGFGAGNGSFYSANPGMKLRIIFGNLG